MSEISRVRIEFKFPPEMNSMAFDFVKTEKLNAITKYCRCRNFNDFMGLIELCLALILLSWVFTFFPFPFRLSSEYLRQLFSVFNSTFFVFVLSNLIIFTIALSFKNFAGGNSVPDIYNEFITNSEFQQRIPHSGDVLVVPEVLPEECFEDKQIVSTENVELKLYQRTKSENLEKGFAKKPCRKLRRSASEICRKLVVSGEGQGMKSVEDMSNEEFRVKIEKFIAMQKWNQKQEELN